MKNTLTFDAKLFLASLVKDFQRTIDYAYPDNALSQSRTHPALQRIQATVHALDGFLKASRDPNEAESGGANTQGLLKPIEAIDEPVYLLVDKNTNNTVFEGPVATLIAKAVELNIAKIPPATADLSDRELLVWADNNTLHLFRKVQYNALEK